MPWGAEFFPLINEYRCSEDARDENIKENRWEKQDWIERNICGFSWVRGERVPFNLGNFLTNAGTIAGGIGQIFQGISGGGATIDPVPTVSPPRQAAVSPPSQVPGPQFRDQLVAPWNPTGPQFQETFTPTFALATPDRPFTDFGEVDLYSGLTTAQQRAYLLREAGRNIGKKRISYAEFKNLVKILGPEAARQRLNLDEQSMVFLLASPPKRRGKGISASQIRNVRNTVNRMNRFNCTMRSFMPAATRARRTTCKKAC